MRRKLWTAVIVTVVLLAVGGGLPGRVPPSWLSAGAAGWNGMVTRLPALRDGAAATATVLRDELVALRPVLERELDDPAFDVVAAALLGALGGMLLVLALADRRRDPLRTVVREMRGGRPVARVARRTLLAQDAVRTLLHPDRAKRRRSRRRREEPSAPAWLARLGRRSRAPASTGMRWVESS
jgi:hypothetical protein